MSSTFDTQSYTGLNLTAQQTIHTLNRTAGEARLPAEVWPSLSGATTQAANYTLRFLLDGTEYAATSFAKAQGSTTVLAPRQFPLVFGVTTITLQSDAPGDTSVDVSSTVYDTTQGPNVTTLEIPPGRTWEFEKANDTGQSWRTVYIEIPNTNPVFVGFDFANIIPDDDSITSVVSTTITNAAATIGEVQISPNRRRTVIPLSAFTGVSEAVVEQQVTAVASGSQKVTGILRFT